MASWVLGASGELPWVLLGTQPCSELHCLSVTLSALLSLMPSSLTRSCSPHVCPPLWTQRHLFLTGYTPDFFSFLSSLFLTAPMITPSSANILALPAHPALFFFSLHRCLLFCHCHRLYFCRSFLCSFCQSSLCLLSTRPLYHHCHSSPMAPVCFTVLVLLRHYSQAL